MRRRVFIAINLPDGLKKRIFDLKEKWGQIPARWTKKESLHLTLVFIGYVDEDGIYEICKLIREIARKREPFSLEFEKILYGPPARLASPHTRQERGDQGESVAGGPGRPPRMIWLKGKLNKEASALKSDLENALMSLEQLGPFKIDKRQFSPHITLARLKMAQWHSMLEPPGIEQDFKAVVPVTSIEVMESDLKNDGAEYVILESCPLGI